MRVYSGLILSLISLLTILSASVQANELVEVQNAIAFTTEDLPLKAEGWSDTINFDQRCLSMAKNQISSLLNEIETSLAAQMKKIILNAFVVSKVKLTTTGTLATADDVKVKVTVSKMTVGKENLNSWQNKVGELKLDSSLAPVAIFPLDFKVEAFVAGDPKPKRNFVAHIGGIPSYRIGIGYIAWAERNVVRDPLDSITADDSSCVYTVLTNGYDIQRQYGAPAQDGQTSIYFNLRLRGQGFRGYSVSLYENDVQGKVMGYLGVVSQMVKVPLKSNIETETLE